MYPETSYSFEGHTWAVWATSKDHFGFSCGSNASGREDDSLLALSVNNVEYRVRFHAKPDPRTGEIALLGEMRGHGDRSWMFYGKTVYITRTDCADTSRHTGEPTESAERKIVELAHCLIASFLASEQGAALAKEGHLHFCTRTLLNTREAVKVARADLDSASLNYGEAEIAAIKAGVDIKHFA
jgi:hypothetical protein